MVARRKREKQTFPVFIMGTPKRNRSLEIIRSTDDNWYMQFRMGNQSRFFSTMYCHGSKSN